MTNQSDLPELSSDPSAAPQNEDPSDLPNRFAANPLPLAPLVTSSSAIAPSTSSSAKTSMSPSKRPNFSKTNLPPPGEPPYKGLNFYSQTDEALYFGRRALAQDLVATITVQPFVAVIGRSGSDKSSLRTGAFFEAFFGLAQDGKANPKTGLPNLLWMAVLMRGYRNELILARPPRPVQTVLFGLLAPIGRLLGYKAEYPYPHPSQA